MPERVVRGVELKPMSQRISKHERRTRQGRTREGIQRLIDSGEKVIHLHPGEMVIGKPIRVMPGVQIVGHPECVMRKVFA